MALTMIRTKDASSQNGNETSVPNGLQRGILNTIRVQGRADCGSPSLARPILERSPKPSREQPPRYSC